jgi:hypothetical protein
MGDGEQCNVTAHTFFFWEAKSRDRESVGDLVARGAMHGDIHLLVCPSDGGCGEALSALGSFGPETELR